MVGFTCTLGQEPIPAHCIVWYYKVRKTLCLGRVGSNAFTSRKLEPGPGCILDHIPAPIQRKPTPLGPCQVETPPGWVPCAVAISALNPMLLIRIFDPLYHNTTS